MGAHVRSARQNGGLYPPVKKTRGHKMIKGKKIAEAGQDLLRKGWERTVKTTCRRVSAGFSKEREARRN